MSYYSAFFEVVNLMKKFEPSIETVWNDNLRIIFQISLYYCWNLVKRDLKCFFKTLDSIYYFFNLRLSQPSFKLAAKHSDICNFSFLSLSPFNSSSKKKHCRTLTKVRIITPNFAEMIGEIRVIRCTGSCKLV